MMRSLFLIATASLAACLSSGCFAQEDGTTDPANMTREQWQAHVKASRERLNAMRLEQTREVKQQIDRMRRDRKSFVAPPPTQDELAEAASRQVLEDNLVPGDIVSTKNGLFRFRGAPDRERKPEDFERLR